MVNFPLMLRLLDPLSPLLVSPLLGRFMRLQEAGVDDTCRPQGTLGTTLAA
jgi:hypothetical protein